MADERRIAIGVDVGGSGVKVGAVDIRTGELVGDRRRVATPQPSTPDAVVAVIARLVERFSKAAGALETAGAPVGVGVPCVVIDGVTRTAANIDAGWVDFDAGAALAAAIGRPVAVLNDADAAGLAEMRFGAGAGVSGTVLVLTLGTGLGSGMFLDGRLFPNTELGHMEIRGRDAERRSASSARTRRGLSWKAWAADLDEHLHAIDRLLWPNLIILGGGVSKSADRFLGRLTVRPPVVAAALRNDAGIVGAAMAAAERAPTAAGPDPGPVGRMILGAAPPIPTRHDAGRPSSEDSFDDR
ncbi:MAG: ROK family protein [Chloroflexi bacterium]|nr:ROK family protein [Chloroflexota bacterium]